MSAEETRHADPLTAWMTAETTPERDAAFLRMYAAKVRDRSASSWEIPNTVATTLNDIANRYAELRASLEERTRQLEEAKERVFEAESLRDDWHSVSTQWMQAEAKQRARAEAAEATAAELRTCADAKDAELRRAYLLAGAAEATLKAAHSAIDEMERRERERLAESLKLPINSRLHDIKSAKLEAYAEVRAALTASPAAHAENCRLTMLFSDGTRVFPMATCTCGASHAATKEKP